jgi:hypothetical protein
MTTTVDELMASSGCGVEIERWEHSAARASFSWQFTFSRSVTADQHCRTGCSHKERNQYLIHGVFTVSAMKGMNVFLYEWRVLEVQKEKEKWAGI